MENLDIFNNQFTIGVNYWASHCGMKMWSDWDEDIIRKDLLSLASNGIKTLRIFPLWSDFQPINYIYGYQGNIEGISSDNGDTLLYDIDESAGTNPIAFNRFEKFLDIAEEYNISVIPSLITGWMSGRLFVPKALEGKNILTDPIALKWEVRFCRYFVKRFKNRKNILAWGLGNECNCCAPVESEEQAWLWTALISNAIKSVDPSRPIVSGMHSITLKKEGYWTFEAQGENCDILTTHPYASPSYKTDSVPTSSFRAVMHPACQTKMYRDLSKKPCIIEETGTFGEMYSDKESTAIYAKNCLINSWAHNCGAYFWWIAFDQGHLTYHPFGYNNRGSNYGVLTADYESKPILKNISEFMDFLNSFEYKQLPKAIVDGICILSGNGQDSWAVGSTTFNLAAQADMNLDFAYIEDDEIPDAPIYFIPSLKSNSVSVYALDRIMKKVFEGATLYLSFSVGLLRNISTDFGVHIKNIEKNLSPTKECKFNSGNSQFTLPITFYKKYNVELDGADAIGYTSDGIPFFTSYNYGKGKLFLMTCGLENNLFNMPDGFDKDYHRIYSIIKSSTKNNRWLSCDNPYITLTEHPLENGNRIIVAVNNNRTVANAVFNNTTDKKIVKEHRGRIEQINGTLTTVIPPNDFIVFEI